MADYIDEMPTSTGVSLALHPGSLREFMTQRGERTEDTAPLLAPLEDALATTYKGFVQLKEARDTAERDPSLTKEAKILKVAELGDKVLERSFAALGRAEKILQNNIATLEAQLSEAVVSKASHHVAVEIRSYVRELKAQGKNPMGFVSEAIRNGDLESASAILGAPAYLSGLTPDQQRVLLNEYHSKRAPQITVRIKAMNAALEYYGRAPRLTTVLEKAIGAPDRKVKALKAAANATKKAFSGI